MSGKELEAHLGHAFPGFSLAAEMQVAARGVTALFGPSGSGKTTLLRAIAGLERARGRVALGGTVWQDDDAGLFVPVHRRRLGYVFQEAALLPHLGVRANLEYGHRRLPAGTPGPSVDEVVAMLDLGPLLGRWPDSLSGGQRQRVALGRALLAAPHLLLLDEPLAALDAAAREAILGYLERLRDETGVPMLLVSHQAGEVERLADRVVAMEAGRTAPPRPVAEWSGDPGEGPADGPALVGPGRGAIVGAPVAALQDLGMSEQDSPGVRAGARLWLSGGDDVQLGEGRVALLEAIAEHGSISAAARHMGMSYRRAWNLVEAMNRFAEEPLVTTEAGGRGGGGAALTAAGERAVASYRELQQRLEAFLEAESRRLSGSDQ
ncbi:MAG: ATP-binding cassette domain-containing protein [Thiohalospira sp.]